MKIIKLIVTSAILSTSIPALAVTTPQMGNYKGTGEWHSADGKSGQYLVNTTIQGTASTQVVSSTYNFDGQSRDWNFTMLAKSPGFFAVASGEGGNVNGSGYCLEVQCHYEVSGGNLEETFSFVDGKLYKIGSKTDHGKTIVWQESLTLTP